VVPDEFIGDTEQLGLMVPLTEWVLREALGHLAAWTAEGLDLTMAVNVSATVLHDPGLVALVDEVLADAGVDPCRLVIEVTEQAAMVNPTTALATMNALCDRGVRFSVDDFGTGQSSLTYLHRLPVSEVKIDRSFIAGLQAGSADAVICRSVIDLAHNLGLQAVAEGVETPEVLELLIGYACDLGQGWALGQPLAAADVPAALAERVRAR
jgi:EAL domain-containing protein (putative c-di-GMP-specific phosphodiesterase class I)